MRWRPPRRRAAEMAEIDNLAPTPGVGACPEHAQRIGVRQVRAECVEGGGVELPQARVAPVHLALTVPDQALVGPGDHLQPLGLFGVDGHRAVMVAVGADHVGQGRGVARVGLGARHDMAFPVTGHRQRVDRVHPVASGHQRRHPQPPIDLDAHRNLGVVVGMLGQQGV